MASERTASGADLDNASRIHANRGGDLCKDGFRGEEMLTQLARQASSVEHAGKLIGLALRKINESGSLEALLAVAREEINQLKAELRTSERNVARLLEMFEEQQRIVNTQQATLVRIERVVMDVVTGRVWRTLRAAGNVIKRIVPGETFANGTSHLRARRNTYLVRDEPLASECRPRRGKITVRGWSVAEGGVECVQVQVADLPLMEAKPSIPRPDVQKLPPNLDTTGRAGFLIEFDSQSLAKGRHPILLRALVNGQVVRESKTFVDIDPEGGFATEYHRWIHEFERRESQLIDLKFSSFALQPKISILMPVYNTKPRELVERLIRAGAIVSALGIMHFRRLRLLPVVREALDVWGGRCAN